MNKNDLKNHISKVFLALGGISTLAASCSKDVQQWQMGMSCFAPDKDYGLSLLPISIYIPEDVNVKGMINFAVDIVSSDELQKKFNDNPSEVLVSYGIKQYDADSQQIQALMAMGDSEVLETIKRNDFNAYLAVMEKKNYLQSDMIKEIKENMQNGLPMDHTKGSYEQTENCVVGVPLILFVAAAVVLVVAIEVGVAIDLGVTVRGGTKSDLNDVRGKIDFASLIRDDAITVFIDKAKSLSSIEIGEEEYVTELRDKLNSIDYIEKEDAESVFQMSCGTIEHLLNEE